LNRKYLFTYFYNKLKKMVAKDFCDINSDDKKDCCGADKNEQLNFQEHWDTIYKNAALDKLGWYEKNPSPTLNLLDEINLNKNATIFNAGAGTTTLVDELLKREFKNIIVNDISNNALKFLKKRIAKFNVDSVKFIDDDLTNPKKLTVFKNEVDIWIDRAVLHFFLKEKEQYAYVNLLDNLVKSGGFIIIATFALDGSKKCSGLAVKRYDKNELQTLLGEKYTLLKSFDYMYITPSGDQRKYCYTLFQKNNN